MAFVRMRSRELVRARARGAQLWAERLERVVVRPAVEAYRVGPFEVQLQMDLHGLKYCPFVSPEVAPWLTSASEALRRLCDEGWTPAVKPRNLGELIFQVQAHIAPLLAAQRCASPSVLARMVAYEFVGLSALQPFVEDDLVDEVYLDDPQRPLYIDHRKHGRCSTNVHLGSRELDALKTHLETYTGEASSADNPSTKAELRLGDVRLRVGIDETPLAVEGTAVHIRKLGGTPFTLVRLVAEGTLGAEEAAFLGTCIRAPINITIVGPSGSGKTSLLNALDMVAPPAFRRVYIEDAVETLDLTRYGFHQTRLRVAPMESGADADGKAKEVLKSLHRSPDILILGEVQTEAHSRALFQSVSSGIRAMQTFHASSPEQAIRRWVHLHGIDPVQLADLGVVVTMVRPDPQSSRRYVSRISYVDAHNLQVEDIFRSAPPFRRRESLIPVEGSPPVAAVDAIRGEGWFVLNFKHLKEQIEKAIAAGALDLESFLGFVHGEEGLT